MEDKQKVYIRGVKNRGNEVIETLKKLGGINRYFLGGGNKNAYYYINPKGAIDYVYAYKLSPEYLLVKEFYKKIELSEIKKWKPKHGDYYYFINYKGMAMRNTWFNSVNENAMYEFGNCFKTKEEAEIARDKIKELLNNKA